MTDPIDPIDPIDPTPVDHPVIPWLTVARRAWLYRLCALLLAVGAGYGIVTQDTAALWLPAIAGLLAAPVAAVNTPTPPTLRRYKHERGAVDPGSFALGVVALLLVLWVIWATTGDPNPNP